MGVHLKRRNRCRYFCSLLPGEQLAVLLTTVYNRSSYSLSWLAGCWVSLKKQIKAHEV